jgi:hypothetical protein
MRAVDGIGLASRARVGQVRPPYREGVRDRSILTRPGFRSYGLFDTLGIDGWGVDKEMTLT